MKPKNSHVVAVGGFDPSAQAGVLADARVFARFGLGYKAVLTAVTAQSAQKFYGWEAVKISLFKEQLRAVEGDVFGVKLGMLATLDHLRVLLRWLQKTRPAWVLWDPVCSSSTGTKLLRASLRHALLRRLLQTADIVTPNILEAESLLGVRIQTREDMKSAARALYRRAGTSQQAKRMIVVKGGHLWDPSSRRVVDLAATCEGVFSLAAGRKPGDPHGSGCHFASALLAALWEGYPLIAAARLAKRRVLDMLFSSPTP